MIENCPMRHENGNCIPAGGFCTANKNICEALLNAYRMGKAQLSQEGTTKDTISRQAAIDLVTDMEFMNFTAKGILRDSLRKLSPAQPEPQWIPVSEGLPKKDGRYQVTRHDYVTNTEFIDILWYEKNTWWDRQATGDYAVTAWMPLPEAYKEGGKKI